MKNLLKITLLSSALVAPLMAQDAAKDHPGKAVYATCAACHQATGAGVPGVFPPLAESEWVNGPAENLIRIQLRGLAGPITVKGVKYAGAVPMPANATMTDQQIADVLTYIRSNFGNKAPAVTPAMVAALRGEVGKPALTAADLIDPNKKPEAKKPEAPKKEEKKDK